MSEPATAVLGRDAGATPSAAASAGRRANTLTAYRWELRKLRAQKRTYAGVGLVTLIPLIFSIALSVRNHQPNDVAFGRYVHESGLAIPLVILIFTSAFFLPLAISLVAGDIFATEDHHGTLKTILTRSLDRGQIFAGKLLAAITYAVVVLLATSTVATVAGLIVSGFHPLTSLSGTHVSAIHALALVFASYGIYYLSALAIVAIGLLLSTTTRNSAAAVFATVMVVLLMNLVDLVPGLDGLRPYVLPHQFDAWMGLLRQPVDWAPIVRAAWVSAAYAIPCAFAAYLVFLRRDVAGG